MVRAIGLGVRDQRRNQRTRNSLPTRRQPFRNARAPRPRYVDAVQDEPDIPLAADAVNVLPMNVRRRVHLPIYQRVHEGKQYDCSHQVADIIYLRCQNHRLCGGTAQIELTDLDLINPITPHNADVCLEDQNALIVSRFTNDLRDELNVNWCDLKALYDRKAQEHPEAANMVSYASVKKSLLHWRQRRFPPMPENLREFAASLNGARLEFPNGHCSTETVVDGGGNSHLLFFNANLLQNEFTDVQTWFLEATNASRPDVDEATQVLNIIGLKQEHLVLGCCAVMSSRSAAAYRECIAAFHRLVPHINVRLILLDYEVNIRWACKQEFPAAHLAACNVQFQRAIYQQIKDLNLENRLRDSSEVRDVVDQVLSLSFLPTNEISNAYHGLINNASDMCHEILGRFFRYFETTWIRLMRPDGFSIFGLFNRTTHAVDSFTSRFQRIIGPHPSVPDFIGRLLVIMDEAVIDVNRLREHLQVRRAPKYTGNCKVDLIQVWRLYTQGWLSTDQLMDIAKNCQRDHRMMLNQLVHVEDELRERHAVNFRNFNDGAVDPEFHEPLVNGQGLAQIAQDLRRIARLPHGQGREPLAPIIQNNDRFGAPAAVQEEENVWRAIMVLMGRQEIEVDANARQNEVQPIDIDNENQNANRCVVCLTNLSDHILLPCRHMQFCQVCARQLYNRPLLRERSCPVCRTQILAYFRIFA